MKKSILALSFIWMAATSLVAQDLVPLTERVNVQADSARLSQIIDGEWVAVGTNKKHAISKDYNLTYKGEPTYRFELRTEDNTLSGYSKGETKGRAELSYCYATDADFADKTSAYFDGQQKMKSVYHYGKGICPQGARRKYTFAIYVPSSMSSDVHTIFAQWHGMPTRTLAQDPDGNIRTLTTEEFLALEEKTIFKKNTGHHKMEVKDKNGKVRKDKQGNTVYKAGKKNGWLIEQGGYPPLAFGFANKYFYIKANSDRKWLTDKSDRCNANPDKQGNMESVTSTYKSSTIAYRLPFEDFPKDCWVTFDIDVTWSTYGAEKETILKPGHLDVMMAYKKGRKQVRKNIVDNQTIQVGRNDESGNYFKFGIYRVGGSTEPVLYNLGGYKEIPM